MLVERRVASVTGLSLGLLCNPAGVAGVSVTVQGKGPVIQRTVCGAASGVRYGLRDGERGLPVLSF